jgi:hypothetical protein
VNADHRSEQTVNKIAKPGGHAFEERFCSQEFTPSPIS